MPGEKELTSEVRRERQTCIIVVKLTPHKLAAAAWTRMYSFILVVYLRVATEEAGKVFVATKSGRLEEAAS